MANFLGNSKANSFAGTWDPDLFQGLGGDDVAYGWDGNDTFEGGAGNDSFFGQDGDDLAYGGTGDDSIQGGGAVDTLYGGAGNDRLMLGGFSGSIGEAYGGTGDDLIQLLSNGTDITLDGGAGRDTAALYFTEQLATGDVVIDFSALPMVTTTAPTGITLTSVEQVIAFLGSAGHHTVIGGAFGDMVYLTDSAQGSTVNTGGGNDTVHANTNMGHNLEGGRGYDILRLNGAGPLTLRVDDATNSATTGVDTIHGFETYETNVYGPTDAIFGRGADRLFGGNYDDIALGGAGNDRLLGRGGADDLNGESGNDFLAGGDGNDLLTGGTGDDTLVGGPGVDTIHGGDGADEIRGGGRGAGVFYGEAGADRFVFVESAVSPHMLADFQTGADSLQFAHILLPGALLPPGALDPARFAIGAAVGDLAQFVLKDMVGVNETWLTWDPNGADPAGGTYILLRFAMGTSVAASDIWLL